MDKESKLSQVEQSFENCKKYLKENSISDEETIDVKDGVISKVEYKGPNGTFTIKYNKQKGQATADVRFDTGTFRSTVNDNKVDSKGSDPVYHPLWGIFHRAFNPS